jgi:hypothetical protein
VALLLPALAILVALWFERSGAEAGAGRRAGIVSAATIPLFVAALGFAIGVFVRSNRLEVADGLIGPEFTVLAVAMLAGSLATVAAIAVPRWTAAAPYVLGATATGFVLFIALIAAPAAEAYKPIPGFARTIQALRTPASVVALRSVSGGNSVVFYTEPGVEILDDPEADFRALVCRLPADDVFVITRGRDADALVRLARAQGRTAAVLQRRSRDALLRVDGPPCTTARSRLLGGGDLGRGDR